MELGGGEEGRAGISRMPPRDCVGRVGGVAGFEPRDKEAMNRCWAAAFMGWNGQIT